MKAEQDRQIIQAYGRVFSSHDGQVVLDHLRLLAKDRILGRGKPEEIFCNVGRHDLVVIIENYIEEAKNA